MDKTKREDTKMPQNPLAGLSRYINVDYREPDESVIDSIFGTYAERMDRDITKANLQLGRDKLKYNADLEQQKYKQGRIDKARQNLMDDIIGTRGAMKGLPAYQIDAAVQKIIPLYSDILGVDESNKVYESSHTDGVDMGEDYVSASKNNYEIIQRAEHGEITTGAQLITENAKINRKGDQTQDWDTTRNQIAIKLLNDDPALKEARYSAFGVYHDTKRLYDDHQTVRDNNLRTIGMHKSQEGIDWTLDEYDVQNQSVKTSRATVLERVGKIHDPNINKNSKLTKEEWNSMTDYDRLKLSAEWKNADSAKQWLKEADEIVLRYEDYEKNAFRFIQDNTDPIQKVEDESPAEVVSNINMNDFVNQLSGTDLNTNMNWGEYLSTITGQDSSGVAPIDSLVNDIGGYEDVAYMDPEGSLMSVGQAPPSAYEPTTIQDVSEVALGDKDVQEFTAPESLPSIVSSDSLYDFNAFNEGEDFLEGEINFEDVLPSYLRPNVLESVGLRKKEDAIAQAPDGTLFYNQDEIDNWKSAQRKYKGK